MNKQPIQIAIEEQGSIVYVSARFNGKQMRKPMRTVERLARERGLPAFQFRFPIEDIDEALAGNERLAAGIEHSLKSSAELLRMISADQRQTVSDFLAMEGK